MSIRLPYALVLALLVVMTSPFWILPVLNGLLVVLNGLILATGAMLWIAILFFESFGAW